ELEVPAGGAHLPVVDRPLFAAAIVAPGDLEVFGHPVREPALVVDRAPDPPLLFPNRLGDRRWVRRGAEVVERSLAREVGRQRDLRQPEDVLVLLLDRDRGPGLRLVPGVVLPPEE